MAKKLTPTKIKKKLLEIIKSFASAPEAFVRHPGRDFSRNRKLSFETMLKMLIGMGGNSLCKELYEWFDFDVETASVAAFVQQRDKILPAALETLFHEFVLACDEPVLFKGYRLLAADGSDLRLPANSNDAETYFKNDIDDAKGYNLVHLDAIYDLLRHVYVDASVQSKKTQNEHKALVSMIDRSNLPRNVILMADRGYESFNNIAHLQEKGWKYIIRAKDSFGIITKTVLPASKEFDISTIVTLTKRQTKLTRALFKENPSRYRWVPPRATFDYLESRENAMYDLQIRVVRFPISDGTYETVFTNLDPDDFPAETLKQLYNMRWGIETSFRELKYTIGLAGLHCKKRNSMLQEVFARLVLYNFSELIVSRANVPQNRVYKINFSAAIHVCKQYFRGKLKENTLLEIIPKHLSPIRPNRNFPRYQKHLSAMSLTYRIA